MEYYTVEEATEKIFTKLTDSTGWKFLKSQRSLKKTFKDLNFEIYGVGFIGSYIFQDI